LYLLLACVSEGCYNEVDNLFILILKPLFIFLLLRICLVHFEANITLKEKFGYQEPFNIKTKAIKDWVCCLAFSHLTVQSNNISCIFETNIEYYQLFKNAGGLYPNDVILKTIKQYFRSTRLELEI
jgi:hypothetical protein